MFQEGFRPSAAAAKGIVLEWITSGHVALVGMRLSNKCGVFALSRWVQIFCCHLRKGPNWRHCYHRSLLSLFSVFTAACARSGLVRYSLPPSLRLWVSSSRTKVGRKCCNITASHLLSHLRSNINIRYIQGSSAASLHKFILELNLQEEAEGDRKSISASEKSMFCFFYYYNCLI